MIILIVLIGFHIIIIPFFVSLFGHFFFSFLFYHILNAARQKLYKTFTVTLSGRKEKEYYILRAGNMWYNIDRYDAAGLHQSACPEEQSIYKFNLSEKSVCHETSFI